MIFLIRYKSRITWPVLYKALQIIKVHSKQAQYSKTTTKKKYK